MRSSETEIPAEGLLPRVGYLGPEGTFSEEALLASAAPGEVEPAGLSTIYETINALRQGEVEWAIVPIENSLEGSLSVTLDLLAGAEADLEIVGEALLSVEHSLIAGREMELAEVETVITHPQVPGQCVRLLRGELAHAKVLPASSTAEAVRTVARERGDASRGMAALGTVLAAKIYGGTVLREGVQDRDDNETRFVWLARVLDGDVRRDPPLRSQETGKEWKTSLVFWGPGADSPGWLVRCLDEFGRREINLTKIESRPKREQMGSYMFFVDLEGKVSDAAVAEAVAGLGDICEEARVLGSYRADVGNEHRQKDAARAGSGAPVAGHDRATPALHSGATDG